MLTLESGIVIAVLLSAFALLLTDRLSADLVAVEGDPLVLAGLADRVVAVYQEGRLVAGAVPGS